jgi:hypothetical protein
MDAIKATFRARCAEIHHYLNMLEFIEDSGSDVVSRDRTKEFAIDTTTRHVLKATVFLHLYNLVESVVKQSLERVAQEIKDSGLTFADVSKEWQRCWIQELAKTSEPLEPARRLKALLVMCDHVLAQSPVVVRPKVPGGSLDDDRIDHVLRRHGITLTISPRLRTAVKRHVVDSYGPLKLVRLRRNDLAHGLASFGDCGRDVSIRDLRSWAAVVFAYLRQLIIQFSQHMSAGGFRHQTTA